MSEHEITDGLHRIGFTDTEIPGIMQDVGRIVLGKVFAAYLEPLPEGERAQVAAMQPEELTKYVSEHPDTLSTISQDRFEQIHDETWQDYFKSVR